MLVAEMNSALLKKFDSTDTPTSVLYGQTIQLLHVATNRYLKANTFTALLEKDCLKLSLEEGSEYSHFRILPRFKVRHEGSPAYYDDMVNLTSPKTGYSIRVTGKPYDEDDTAQALLPGDDADPPPLPPRPRLNEANLSPTPSDLKLVKFSANPLIPANASSLLTNYSVFTLYHAESECMLAASCDPHKGTPERHIPSPHQTPLTPLTPTDPTSLHDAYLRPLATPNPASPANNSPKTLFTLDYLQPKSAHRVTWDPPTRIKHLVTGKYLYVNPIPDAQGRHHLLLSLTPPTGSSSLFNVSPISLQSQYLAATANTSMRLHHNLVTPTGTVQVSNRARRAQCKGRARVATQVAQTTLCRKRRTTGSKRPHNALYRLKTRCPHALENAPFKLKDQLKRLGPRRSQNTPIKTHRTRCRFSHRYICSGPEVFVSGAH